MMEAGMSQSNGQAVEEVLLDELTRGDAIIEAAGPILRHLLENNDQTIFSDEIVARVRGMVGDLARQLLTMQAHCAGDHDPYAFADENFSALAEMLTGNSALLAHAHGLALEFHLTERIQSRNGIDPVLSPLVQALVSSSKAATAGTAVALLASQARFMQQQRRMELPLTELPGDLFHSALLTLRAHASEEMEGHAETAEAKLRDTFDEGRGRLGLMTRLIMEMEGEANRALSVSDAGVPLFLTALALASGQDRLMVVLSTNDRQYARFALSLRAAGLKSQAVDEQFAYFHPDMALPCGFAQLRDDRAAAILAGSPSGAAE